MAHTEWGEDHDPEKFEMFHEKEFFDEEVEDEVDQGPFVLCNRCRGKGTVWHSALAVWTQDDVMLDPDGFQDMMDGVHDVVCPQCNGLRVVSTEMRKAYVERVEDQRLRDHENGDWGNYAY